MSPADLHERGHGTLEMRRLAGGTDLNADTRLVLGHHGVGEAHNLDALVEEIRRNPMSEPRVPEHDGHDRVLPGAKPEARFRHRLAEPARVGREPVATLGGL